MIVIHFIRSLIFMIGLIIATIIHATLSFLTFPFPYRFRYWFITLWSRFMVHWVRLSCGIRYQVEGLEHLPKQNAIVLAKHQSMWETFALQAILPPQAWVLKRELLRIPFFGWALALLEPIAIDRSDRKRAYEQLFTQGRAILEKGRWIVVFPEGTRTAPGRTTRYKQGGAALAVETGYPVVPIAHNAGQFWPRRGFIKKPGLIRVVIGPTLTSEGKTPEQLLTETKTWIETTMANLDAVD